MKKSQSKIFTIRTKSELELEVEIIYVINNIITYKILGYGNNTEMGTKIERFCNLLSSLSEYDRFKEHYPELFI